MRLPSDLVSLDLGARRQNVADNVRAWTGAYYDLVDLIWAQCENLGLREQRLEMTLSHVDGWTVTGPPNEEAS